MTQLVETLRYKPEGRGFDWNFYGHNSSGCTMVLGLIQPRTELTVRISFVEEGVQAGESQPPGTCMACRGL
jgi:hypothetical protein